MARHPSPPIDPLPSAGGSYLLEKSTGRWIKQARDAAQQPAEPDPVTPIDIEDDGTDPESPAAGEG
jgi:hypothetical protein